MIYDFFLYIVVLAVLGALIKPCTEIKHKWVMIVCVLLTSFIAILALISGLAALWVSLIDDNVIFWKEWIAQAKELIEGGS
mgnify:CR=1 FL=1